MILLPVIFTNTHSYFPMPYLILVCLQVGLNHLLTVQSKGSYIKKLIPNIGRKLSTIRQLDYVHDYLH